LLVPVFMAAAQNTTRPDRPERPENARLARIEAIKKLCQAQTRRAENAIDRMDKLIDRIDEYIAKLEASGVDTTSVENLMDQATDQKNTADDLLIEAENKCSAIGTAELPKQAVKEYMTAFNNLKKQMISLHKTLKEIVRSLKSLERDDNEEENEND